MSRKTDPPPRKGAIMLEHRDCKNSHLKIVLTHCGLLGGVSLRCASLAVLGRAHTSLSAGRATTARRIFCLISSRLLPALWTVCVISLRNYNKIIKKKSISLRL